MAGQRVDIGQLENGLARPLLTDAENKQNGDEDEEIDDSEEAAEDSRKPATSIGSAYRLLTPSVKVLGCHYADQPFFVLICFCTIFLRICTNPQIALMDRK
jgi:hypothetical protein